MTVNPCHRQLTVLSMAILLFQIIITDTTSLKGKNLIILPTHLQKYMETNVNSSGHVIESNGSVPEMLNWLSNRFQFDYSFVPSVECLVPDDAPNQRGKLSYLKNNEADMAVGLFVITYKRFQQADFPMPLLWSSFGILVPAPKSTTSVTTLLHPWKFEVWIGVGLALPMFIFCLFGLSKCYSKLVRKDSIPYQDQNNLRDISFDSIIKYVVEVILSQGGFLKNSVLFIRIATAAWCLACFVLVQSYNCTLISVLTVPQFLKPIINSIYDVPRIKYLRIVVDRGLAADNLLSYADFGVFKKFGTMLGKDPGLRCNKTEQCIDRVKTGSNVYVALAPYLDFAIDEDYKKQGSCHIVLLNERFMSSLLGFAVGKKSVYMEEFNRGIEELMAYGLVQYWDKKYVAPKKELCHFEKRQTTVAKTSLSLTNMASAFSLLILGYILTFFVFLVEIIAHYIRSILQ